MGSFHIRFSADLLTGLALLALGLVTSWGATQHAIGSPARMGPGFMPLAIGVALAGFGTILVVDAMLRKADAVGMVSLRPLIWVVAGVVAFGLLIDSWGLLSAVAALVLFGRFASPEMRLVESVALAATLALFGAAVFVWGLGLPLPLVPR